MFYRWENRHLKEIFYEEIPELTWWREASRAFDSPPFFAWADVWTEIQYSTLKQQSAAEWMNLW